ncbi:UDP-N-acetyl-D-galactosamine:polypeptide N-acetylgalactosaminyltransferase [Cryptosporidium ubiquitum]|uniref:UDP-N-acetyl-D-galactosamine:polypeptide N-acetylgalactosaminyltransferase n=1 Tax=Cryptosporidium ubiquitum TaxID=857276 RepID=A0A1J4MEJ0_9CRYT|nr:UDP-N-acetyl-D-galactosamine:polypeptide N-acetylgalactosaminyltransferase [Cryptosporidium ubiquitum]OII71285.1 UDP-N-acetyl-D-galactosamine:polypeptide N-acetylgalactosaminyltransferase [Cryptosporidium ubiquitum]
MNQLNGLRRLFRRLQNQLGRAFVCRNSLVYLILVIILLWALSFTIVHQIIISNVGSYMSSSDRLSLRGMGGKGLKVFRCLIKGNCINNAGEGNNVDFMKLVDESDSRHQSYIIKLRTMPNKYNLTEYGNVKNLTESVIITKYFDNLAFASPKDTGINYNSDLGLSLVKKYGLGSKILPYVEHKEYSLLFSNTSQQYLNSFAVFPGYNKLRQHGILGIFPNGTTPFAFIEMPPQINSENEATLLGKGGGFYRQLSDFLSLDRFPEEVRDPICRNIVYPIKDLDDVSIIITFYNEPLSTLLRSVHSVLNNTPPPLLREIILVNDGSDMIDLVPGGFLDDYIRLLPKVSVIHLTERTGIVNARLNGIRVAVAPVVVILDSHIETSRQWLEPQLLRLKESPKSVVMPQIDSIDPENFSYTNTTGIGCRLGFKYSIVEQASLTGPINDTTPIKSPMMAGGLFAIRRDYFWELGGYDEKFKYWGAENVEMSLRIWMCGGQIECTPCSRVFHIFRKKGAGYVSPPNSLWINRLRTARIWMDEFYQITETMAPNPNIDLGSFDDMLHLKKKLKCKSFRWFLDNIAPDTYITQVNQLLFVGEIRSKKVENVCLDSMNGSSEGDQVGIFYCHGKKGTQAFIMSNNTNQIRLASKESYCIGKGLLYNSCSNLEMTNIWKLENDMIIKTEAEPGKYMCLSLVRSEEFASKYTVKLLDCEPNNPNQHWKITKFIPRKFTPLKLSYTL